MRRALSTIALVLLIVAGVLWWRNAHPTKLATPTQTVTFKKACDVFTLRDATAVLGDGTVQVPSHTDHTEAQNAVTTCFYTYDPGSLSDLVSASVLLQGSSSVEAKRNFAAARPSNAQTVKGYGEAAFWNPTLGQLNILNGVYWLTIDAGSGAANLRSQDLPRHIADIIMKQL